MTYITLDAIVKSVLLRRGYSMHWYLQFLKYGSDCIRELSIRTLKKVSTKVLTVSANGTIDLPADYVAWVRVGFLRGQYVVPLVQGKGSYFQLSHEGLSAEQTEKSWLSTWLNNTNEWGEQMGGVYGYGAGAETDIFQEMKERGQIQVSKELAGRELVLDYISNPSTCDNITRVDVLAQATIEQYIVWQMKEHARHYGKNEAKDEERMYWNEERHLRARMNPLTEEDFLRMMRRGYKSSIKS